MKHTDTILSNKKEKYSTEGRSERHDDEYYQKVPASRVKSAESTKTSYHKNLDKSHDESAEASRVHYHKDREIVRVEC